MAIEIGKYNTMPIVKELDFGVYLSDGEGEEILLPKKYVPEGSKIDDELEVFIYHDSEGRIIATTQKPNATVGEIAMMTTLNNTDHGTFVDWGIAKDLLIPDSQKLHHLELGKKYLILVYLDKVSGRIAGTQKLHHFFKNENIALHENDKVDIVIFRKTPMGYECIVNHKHVGLIHFADSWGELEVGKNYKAFVKNIREDQKLDLVLGERGYEKINDEQLKIIDLLSQNGGYLPFHDKSSPEEIYKFFGMSKKTFKMTLGALYKSGKIILEKNGFKFA